ncbi:MAG: PhzF family phenazine biosynthesis protein [Candidatus Eremiobacteraeota bacterium]|nr:PhzF family phenazine biosynthesis protein [Candidatus Eremiobacteraeota bacterium]
MKRRYEYVIVDVFTSTPFKGNPLAVIPDAQGLSDVEMQAIAAEFNLSETVFLLPPLAQDAAVRVRIFTPRRELPFAGHPTIGAAAVFCDRSGAALPFVIEEEVGPIRIDADGIGSRERILWLTTPAVTFYETVDREFCATLLGLEPGDVRADVPPTFASAGSSLLFICLRSTEAVDRAQLQGQHLARALGSVDSVGTFIFARKEPNSTVNFDVYSRMFAPQTGVPEDPATGGATGPLAAYMMRYGLLPAKSPATFTSEQGSKMGRQSLLHVRTDPIEGTIKVGGSTVAIARGELEV